MNPRFVLHLGYGKCASTYVQQLAWCNEGLLASSGIRLSRAGLVGVANHGLSPSFCDQNSCKDLLPASLEALDKELHDLDAGESLLVSSEYLVGNMSHVRDVILKMAPPSVDLEGVILLRRQDRLVESWYCQEIVNMRRLDEPIMRLVDELWATGILNYAGLVELACDIFSEHGGKARVYTLEQMAATSEDPLVAILGSSCLDSASWDQIIASSSGVSRNQRLSIESILLLKHIYSHFGASIFEMFMGNRPKWFPIAGSKNYLSYPKRKLVLAQSNSVNHKLIELFSDCKFDDLAVSTESYALAVANERRVHAAVLNLHLDKALEWLCCLSSG